MVDASVPSVVRGWNYLVGGRDNFEADRAAFRRLRAAVPLLPQLGRAGRAFYGRVVSCLAGETGIRQFIDISLGMPTSVVMIDVLNFVEDPGGVIARLTAALPSGSCVAVMQVVRDERLAVGARWWSNIVHIPLFLRDREEVARWLDGLELVEPGIVEVHQWRPAPGDRDYPAGMPLLGAVARKP